MPKELDVAIKTAKNAGKILLEHYEGRDGKRTMKSDHDFFTEADIAAEKVIVDAVRKQIHASDTPDFWGALYMQLP